MARLEERLYLFVGEAPVAARDGVREAPAAHFGSLVDLEDDAVGEFVLVGTEGADLIAEALGHHGDGAVDEVDAGAALDGFLVDDGALGDVVGDIGDMDANLI